MIDVLWVIASSQPSSIAVYEARLRGSSRTTAPQPSAHLWIVKGGTSRRALRAAVVPIPVLFPSKLQADSETSLLPFSHRRRLGSLALPDSLPQQQQATCAKRHCHCLIRSFWIWSSSKEKSYRRAGKSSIIQCNPTLTKGPTSSHQLGN